ncbi:pyridoxal phosphate-dependent aminotransferase [Prochlorococcus marinus]|uniref:Aminotransferase n=1 Tax=Prochlorococcus marinus XMU1408 TaxID=2213228 RepID=A0A318R239_PROMR|nr:histidinol-phosphate transaminase [Prochlorococcus marinus]MBW3041247.1 histidinol-phosphate aminotransferase [Prochlorococcus marinus str. XMU1408]PYE03836.1 histidinol-phosphate aminotransferase [Prochlorococcus marinus XMU1408]
MNNTNSSFLDMPNPREEIKALNPYSAPLEGRRNLLRLDFNENTIGPSPLVIESLRKITRDEISIYPEYSGLKEKLIDNLIKQNPSVNLNSSEVGIFNGVDAAINAVFHAYGNINDLMLTTSPTFGYYTPCAQMRGMKIISVPYEDQDFQYPFNQICKLIIQKSPKILLICNPNNPTGTRLSPEKIIEITKLSSQTLIVVDELYEAFTGDSVLPFVNFQEIPNLLVLRSLSKTAGLAGLRIGFAIGNSTVINIVKSVTGPYDVNSFAVIAAFAALNDPSYIDSYVNKVLNARNWLKKTFEKFRVKYHIDGGNYFLLWPKSEPEYVEQKLKLSGILIRNMDKKKDLKGSIRVSIGTIDQMKRFWSVFKVIDKV